MARLLLTLAVCLLPSLAFAQATAIDPAKATVVFTPSPDHAAVDPFGVATVTRYELEVIAQTGTGAVAFTYDLGKPSPSQNEIRIPASSIPPFGSLATGVVHRAVVSAIGPGGSARSEVSNPFGRPGPVPLPGAPAGVRVEP